MIISFEGVDGAGKNTLVTAVEKELLAREVAVARLAFPRYEHSTPAHLAQEALYQRMGDLTDSIYGMATLFALDRHDVADELAELDGDGYVVLLDRYTASNAAYSVARQTVRDGTKTGSDSLAEHPIVDWVASLEFGHLGVPVPDLQILVDVEASMAGERAQLREAEDASRTLDAYETDQALQRRTVEAYRDLAVAHWRSPWKIVDASDNETQARAEEIADIITRALDVD
ncbi:dTMP kinase [Corynebacterium anserum]|uniref:Thymidylate kinase n=1 Tax=Corynebacterium anserum TaxID=2684406 RepID=A0A7G7YPP2_9CORY|nr:dTMP kinase [Corynebacterium anserum]MBC2682101.1 dTMP kinase [Corynebacterium anserum]QNH96462.1 dTMP kinase [Corynebacterium anserum]